MGCTGSEQKYSWQDVIPPWQKGVSEKVGGLMEGQLGQVATPYEGPLYANIDPMVNMANTLITSMMGYGPYNPYGYGGYGQGYGSYEGGGYNTVAPYGPYQTMYEPAPWSQAPPWSPPNDPWNQPEPWPWPYQPDPYRPWSPPDEDKRERKR